MIVSDKGSVVAPDARANRVHRLVIGGVLVLVGALWITERAGWTDLSATSVLALAALAIGVVLMIEARNGEHPRLIVVGIFLIGLTGVTAAAPFEGFQGGLGDKTLVISAPSELDDDYELGAGSLVLDLSGLEWSDDLGTITINVGIGEIRVLLPEAVDLDARARVGAGRVEILDNGEEGLFAEEDVRSATFDSSDRRVTIEANVLVGTIEMVQS